MRKILQNKVTIYYRFLLLFLLTMIAGCANYDYSEEKPFIITSLYSAGPDDYRNMYPDIISIENDGTLRLYSKGNDQLHIGNDAPVLTIMLNQTQLNQVKKTVERERFWRMPEDLSTPSEDGAFSYIAVNLKDKSKEVGGLNVDHHGFYEIRKTINDLIDNDDYKKWREEIEEHIWENNSLLINEKTDYIMNKPFLELSMEKLLKTGSEVPKVYLHHITIDMNGNLELFAEATSDHLDIKSDAPILEMKLTDNDLEHLKETILENYWKLNHIIRSDNDGNRMESITVNLTEESKIVRGTDPDNSRFITIRDEIIQLIGDDYERWLEEIEEYISELLEPAKP